MDLYNRIVTGQAILEIKDKFFVVKDPSPKEKMLAEYKYESAYTYFLQQGMMSKKELEILVNEKGIWDDKKELDLNKISNLIKKIDIEILESKFNPVKQEKLQGDKERFTKIREGLAEKKYFLSTRTADYAATLEKYKFLVFLCTYDLEDKRVWSDWEVFVNTEESLINKIVNKAFFDPDITETSIRKIARTEPWRSTWITARRTGQLFPHAASEMTDLQRMLVTWSLMYDSVYENPDCPSEDIINNDALLDQWFDKQKNKKSQVSKNDKINNAQEIGIIVPPDKVKDVYNMNDDASLNKIKTRSTQIESKSSLKESEFKDVQLENQMKRNKQFIQDQKKK